MVWCRIAMGLVAMVLVTGCASQPSSVSIDSAASDGNHPADDSAPTESWDMTVDEQFRQIAEEVPAFAGLLLDGSVYVFKVTDGRQDTAEAARAVAVDILDIPELATARIRAEPASYSWAQLFEWYQRMTDVLAVEGVVMTDIDERANLIVIGVLDEDAHAQQVRDWTDSVGIPQEAVDVIETGAAELL